MSMLCVIQSFKKTDAEVLISDAQVADYVVKGNAVKCSLPLGLVLVETIALLFIFGGLCYYHPKYWHIWLAAGFVLFGFCWFNNRHPKPAEKTIQNKSIEPEEELYLDKAWHGIHYLLTLSDWEGQVPLCYLVRGGTEIGSEKYEYGRPRLLNTEESGRFYQAISNITSGFLRDRYVPERMKQLEIYPNQWNDKGEYEYLQNYFENLKVFLKSVAESGYCMVISIT